MCCGGRKWIHRAVPGRKAPSAIHVRNFHEAGALAANALAAACLSEIRIAGGRARLGFAELVAKENAGDGSASPEAGAEGSRRGSHACRGHAAPPGWFAAGLRAARILL